MKRPARDTNLLFLLLLPTAGILIGFFLGNFITLRTRFSTDQNQVSMAQSPKTQAANPLINAHNSFEDAISLAPGVETQGTLSTSDNTDFYKFNIDSPSRIKIVFDHLPSAYQMTVYNSQKQVVASTDRKGFSYSEGIVAAQEKGTYYVKVVSNYSDMSTTPYTIRIAILPFFE